MKNKTIEVNSIKETNEFALNLAKNAHNGDIYCLEGDLGVGKTVIAKCFGKFFKLKEEITSPTFTILKSYNVKGNSDIKKIYHFDLYRIKSIDELENIGFNDYIYDNSAITLIEWPKIAYEILPKNIKKIIIKKIDNNEFNRKITYYYN